MDTARRRTVDSPIGPLVLAGDGDALTTLAMVDQSHPPAGIAGWRDDPGAFADVVEQLEAYFAGERTTFDVSIRLVGSAFQRRVWAALRAIPYGQTCSYAELAERVGSPGAARAVGQANGRNPVAVIVPCHRVVAAGGTLGGYGGGLDRKRTLLDLEGARLPRPAVADGSTATRFPASEVREGLRLTTPLPGGPTCPS